MRAIQYNKGHKFGRLTFIEEAEPKVYPNQTSKHRRALFECDCGVRKTLYIDDVRQGKTKSCGKHRRSKLPTGVAAFNHLLCMYKGRAKTRNFTFSLTADEFKTLTQGNCVYCNAPPSQQVANTRQYNGTYIYNGVDRIDNNVGYVKENCVSCCFMCNRMKLAYSREEFLDQCTAIAQRRADNKVNENEDETRSTAEAQSK